LRLGSKFSSGLFADQSYRRVAKVHPFAPADPASFNAVSRNQGLLPVNAATCGFLRKPAARVFI